MPAGTLNQVIFAVAVVVWLLLVYRTFKQWRVMKKWVEPRDLARRMEEGEDLLVIDVRTSEEFVNEGHIKGAINLPLKDLSGQLSKIRAQLADFSDLPIIVVCKVGGRSTAAVPRLARAGLKTARIMRGGMRRWMEQGLSVQRD